MMPFNAHLARPEILPVLQRLTAAGECYLVGGALRDWLLGRPIADLDLATPGDPTPMARGVASQLDGHWFWLDRERRQSRVLLGEGERCLSLDFAPFRAPTLAEDLAARDFTINAMALDLGRPLIRENLIDLLGGYRDLRALSLRMAGPGAFSDDPLRVLRGIRHALELSLTIEAATLRGMQAAALDAVAVERVRQEVWQMFGAPESQRMVALLQESGAGRQLWGDVFERCVQQLQSMILRDRLCREAFRASLPTADRLLHDACEEGLDRGTLVTWGLWLRTLGADLADRSPLLWRCSRQAGRRLRAIAGLGPEHREDLGRVARRPRSLALWTARLGADRYDPLLAMATLAAEPVAEVSAELAPLLRELSLQPGSEMPKALVDGRWITAELGIAGGTELGRLLDKLREAEIYGVVQNEEAGRSFLRTAVQKNH